MLKDQNLTHEWWGRAIAVAAYTKNCCLSKSNTVPQTPFELFNGSKPDVSNIRIFGCKVFALDESNNTGKLDDRAFKGIFVGYAENAKGYLVYLTKQHKVIISCNTKFNEQPQSD